MPCRPLLCSESCAQIVAATFGNLSVSAMKPSLKRGLDANITLCLGPVVFASSGNLMMSTKCPYFKGAKRARLPVLNLGRRLVQVCYCSQHRDPYRPIVTRLAKSMCLSFAAVGPSILKEGGAVSELIQPLTHVFGKLEFAENKIPRALSDPGGNSCSIAFKHSKRFVPLSLRLIRIKKESNITWRAEYSATL